MLEMPRRWSGLYTNLVGLSYVDGKFWRQVNCIIQIITGIKVPLAPKAMSFFSL